MNLKPLVYFAKERQRILLKRRSGAKPPWTSDPILQTYKFCNVFRNDDRVTNWIHTNWLHPHADDPWLWFAMGMARYFNWPPTLEGLGYPHTWDRWEIRSKLETWANEGRKIYSEAYTIAPGPVGVEKYKWVVHGVLEPYRKGGRPPKMGETLEEYHAFLTKFQGIGDFIAYEIVCDLRWSYPLCNANDIYSWGNPGPGAVRGLNRLLGRNLKGTPNRRQCLMEMRQILDTLNSSDLLPKDLFPKPLELRDVEGLLCETDKYLRIFNGEGTTRAKFSPTL